MTQHHQCAPIPDIRQDDIYSPKFPFFTKLSDFRDNGLLAKDNRHTDGSAVMSQLQLIEPGTRDRVFIERRDQGKS